MIIHGFDSDHAFYYENGFFLTSDFSRIGKILSHYEIYKRIVDIPGEVIECGVFKGSSFVRWAIFRNILESPFSRKIVGFDTFDTFPEAIYEPDNLFRDRFVQQAGLESLTINELRAAMRHKNLEHFELVQGDITQTVPAYTRDHPALKVALLHLDADMYEPTKTALEAFFPRLVQGGILILDDYGNFPGETAAVDEFFNSQKVVIHKLPISHQSPSFIIKQ